MLVTATLAAALLAGPLAPLQLAAAATQAQPREEQDGTQAAAEQDEPTNRRDPLSFGRARTFRIDFSVTLQEDVRRSYEGAELTAGLDRFELRRARIGASGTLFDFIDFEIERELTKANLTDEDIAAGLTATSRWKDAYVDVGYFNNAQVRIGRFKVPFGLDQLTSATQGDFIYRTLSADHLAPARDAGLMVHGRFFRRALNYWAGAFQHDGDNARSKTIAGGGRTVAARVTGLPLRWASESAFGSLEVGGALTVSDLANDSFRPNGLRVRTTMTEDTFFSPVYVQGRRARWGAELDWMLGPMSTRAEYTDVRDDRLSQSITNGDLPDARYRAWYVSGTWLVTGDTKRRPLEPRAELMRGGIGAVELAARYERLWVDSAGGTDTPFRNPRAETILPSGNRVLTFGVNWLFNRFAGLQLNVIRQKVEDPARSPILDGAHFWSQALRLQIKL